MKPSNLLFVFFLFILRSSVTADRQESPPPHTSIVFATFGRSSYAFDIYSLPIDLPPSKSNELKLTDGKSVNYNGHFPSPSSLTMLPPSLKPNPNPTPNPPPVHLLYVTERNGSSFIYLDSVYHRDPDEEIRKRSVIEASIELNRGKLTRLQTPLVGLQETDGRVSMKDKPSLVGDSVVYLSTHEDPGLSRKSWAAVYKTRLTTGLTRRLTPYGVADFSPAVSPSGVWTAVASSGEKGWQGEIQELYTDIYLFLTSDGSNRVKVVEHGGWPAWADDSTLYFHRRSADGWWSIFRATLPEKGELVVDSVVIERVTPPGFHAFTPAASTANKRLVAMATRRPDSEYRHIELYDVVSREYLELTRHVEPYAHHLNPFISPDAKRVGYHRCRGVGGSKDLLFEHRRSPVPGISMFRLDGKFPSFSPDGKRIAFVKFPGVYVVNTDGSGLKRVFSRTGFATAWDRKRKGVIYTSAGPTFETEDTEVHIVSINVDDDDLSYQQLTKGGANNAFPSPSPDGKWVVFRSGRTGHKNLYIIDAVVGESSGLFRLTEGPWTDTMPAWSPDGDWIVFSSDREDPGSGAFELYMVRPNATGLRKLDRNVRGGRENHVYFSPDGKYIVFASDYAAVSAEPISNPHQYQPYGDIIVMKMDGSDIRRLTHNSYEDGTPAWGSTFMSPVDIEWPNSGGSRCSFDDCHWLSIEPVEAMGSNTGRTQCAHG